MAKKANKQRLASGSRARSQGTVAAPPGRQRRMLLGGMILVLVIGLGLLIRYRQQQGLAPRLQGASDNHYTRGVANAAVVIKEFSDYG